MKKGADRELNKLPKKHFKLLNKKGAVEGIENCYVLPNQICLIKGEKRDENSLVARPGKRRGPQCLLWAPASQ